MVWSWSVRIGWVSSCGLGILTVFQDIPQRCICNGMEADRFRACPFHSDVTVSP